MNFMTRVVTLALFCISAGCAVNGSQQHNTREKPHARGQPDIDYSFYTDADYQLAYLRIYMQAEHCIKTRGIARTRVIGKLQEANGSASIDVAQQGLSGTFVHMPIRITTENGRTKVSVKNDLRRWDVYALAVKGWVLNGDKSCSPQATP